jgi:hypothetical protein
VIAVYARPGVSRPQFVLLAFPVADVREFQNEVRDLSVDAALRKFMGGVAGGIAGPGLTAAGSGRAVDAGPLGGAMRCQQIGVTGSQVGVCAWGDRSYFALNLMIDPGSLGAAAQTTRDLRSAAEH